jgi:hypothetical protein
VDTGEGRPRQTKRQDTASAQLYVCCLSLICYSTREELEIKTTAYDTFNHNIRMLNESMGMCLPAMTVRDPN